MQNISASASSPCELIAWSQTTHIACLEDEDLGGRPNQSDSKCLGQAQIHNAIDLNGLEFVKFQPASSHWTFCVQCCQHKLRCGVRKQASMSVRSGHTIVITHLLSLLLLPFSLQLLVTATFVVNIMLASCLQAMFSTSQWNKNHRFS